jgi:hypothetical protein
MEHPFPANKKGRTGTPTVKLSGSNAAFICFAN